MSHHELRNLREMLQALAYPKTQSFVDTFQSKASSASSSSLRNFQCMAELLYWLACLYDPTIFPANFKFGVKQESDRIQFVNFLVNELYTRGNIQLNAIHLYKADGSAIVELIKIASPLYKAINQDYDETCTELKESRLLNFILDDESIQHIGHCASLTSQLGTNIDRKSLGDWSSQIEMRTVQLETLHSLAVSSAVGTQSNAAGNAVQQDIKALLDSVLYDVNHLQKKCRLLGLDEKDILERIKQASTEIITKHRQLESLQGTKPVFIDEYTEIETELQEYYRMFVTNAQNVYFLKKEMEANHDARFHKKAMTDRMDPPPLNGDYPAVKSDDEQRGEDSHHVTEISIKDDHTSSNLPQKSRSKIALDTGSEKADSMAAFSRGGLSSSNVSSVSESIADDESFNNNIESDCNTDDSGVQNDPDLSSDDDF